RRVIDRLAGGIVDALDDVALPAHSGVGEDGVSGGQFRHIRFEGAEVDGRKARHVADAGRGGDAGDFVQARPFADAHADRIARLNQTLFRAHDPLIGAVRIFWRPVRRLPDFATGNRAVVDSRARQQAFAEGGGVDKRLEGRTDLARGSGRNGTVVFALGK